MGFFTFIQVTLVVKINFFSGYFNPYYYPNYVIHLRHSVSLELGVDVSRVAFAI